MIHYHGTPCGATRIDVARFLSGRHALIPFVRSEDIGTAAEFCQSFCVDNGAFSAWKQGVVIDWETYYEFVREWHRHPAFDWAVIPDVIDGSENDNDRLVEQWPMDLRSIGVPVWHLHESLDRLEHLTRSFHRVALGSSGDYSSPGTSRWWSRMGDAMRVACDEHGRPKAKLHGLRMLDPAIFQRLPLSSADSTNAVRNSSNYSRFGTYIPPNASTRMAIIAERIESHQSRAVFGSSDQLVMFD
ncbi:hypothetical protein [Tuwongella immobilis]|uniref:Uncharacterized protein n=1 Tax=Tuwongella immobilis TaxID=692036 RepID=A0A6C2YW33_9BACT|nr:hypothetical protein [Tuwongella immobilis]VIP05587.1 Uncharacterized protein OS=Pseudomonas aeruginosa BL07 GN=Q061_01745 PE=4 SV=1 [Tuwongella immobilis]VTS08529.1 Uncharacterized protein OS=Pseudomonas aeruginosa BL07 GN=Q061_01745 PE=4 SV=1 [Tuwongella immobilis]